MVEFRAGGHDVSRGIAHCEPGQRHGGGGRGGVGRGLPRDEILEQRSEVGRRGHEVPARVGVDGRASKAVGEAPGRGGGNQLVVLPHDVQGRERHAERRRPVGRSKERLERGIARHEARDEHGEAQGRQRRRGGREAQECAERRALGEAEQPVERAVLVQCLPREREALLQADVGLAHGRSLGHLGGIPPATRIAAALTGITIHVGGKEGRGRLVRCLPKARRTREEQTDL